MKTNTLFLVLFATLLLSLASVSAAPVFTVSPQLIFSDSTSTQILTISNTGNETATFSIPSPFSITDGTNLISIAQNTTTILNGTSGTLTLTRGAVPTAFKLGSYDTILPITGTNVTSSIQNATVTFVKTLCSNGTFNATGLNLDIGVSNVGEGDDLDWKLLDEIEVDVTFENNKNVDLDTVYFEFALVKANSGSDVSDDLLWSSKDDDKIKMGDVDSGDDVSHTFSFKVPNTLDDGNYLLMLRAYTKANSACIDLADGFDSAYATLAKAITITREDEEARQIVIEDITLDSDSAICGGEATISAKAYNIGEEDQDAVKIYLVNKELGLKLEKLITNFDMTDDAKSFDFSFTVPKNATAKTYSLSMFSLYGYDRDNDDDRVYSDSAFDQNSETINKNFIVTCTAPVTASITADFSSETPKAVIGNQVIIEATIKNTGTSSATYTLDISGNSDWSSLAEIDPKSFTLAPGESKTVSIYLDIAADATETAKEFTITATSGTTSVQQKVQVNLEKGFSGQALINHFKTNWFIYAIVLVNLILIIAIIIAVKSIMRKN